MTDADHGAFEHSGMGDPPPAAAMGRADESIDDRSGAVLAAAGHTNRLLGALLLILVGGALYAAAAFFMPLVLAALLALTLSPVVRALGRRGLSEALAAGLVVLIAAAGTAALFWALSGPFYMLIEDAPRMAGELRERFEDARAPMEQVSQIAESVDETTGGGAGIQQVTIQQPGILSQVAGSALSIVTTTAIVVVLTLFLLANETHFSLEIVRSFGRMTEKKRTLRTVRDVEG